MKTLAYRIHRPATAATEVVWVGIALGVGCLFGGVANHRSVSVADALPPNLAAASVSAPALPCLVSAAIVAVDQLRGSGSTLR